MSASGESGLDFENPAVGAADLDTTGAVGAKALPSMKPSSFSAWQAMMAASCVIDRRSEHVRASKCEAAHGTTGRKKAPIANFEHHQPIVDRRPRLLREFELDRLPVFFWMIVARSRNLPPTHNSSSFKRKRSQPAICCQLPR
jgi:hypothetical protein